MKTRILSLIVVLLLLLFLCGCGGSEPAEWIPVRGGEQSRDISRENRDEAPVSAASDEAASIPASAEATAGAPAPSSEPSPASEPASSLPCSEPVSEAPSPTLAPQTEAAQEAVGEAASEPETAAPLPDRANPAQTEPPEPESEAEPEAQVRYVANTNTKKFHTPSCSSVTDMKESNKLYFTGSREELIAQGYEPCKRCKP
ncbi:MAG: hypothetical protein IKQ04_08670 [Oscillospiraceae bacterium]|nr:hypothetical protein [Oscillospiraceae bacterium]MBR7009338.1 hypothetical protein [Oscillospiraceae bacterium]